MSSKKLSVFPVLNALFSLGSLADCKVLLNSTPNRELTISGPTSRTHPLLCAWRYPRAWQSTDESPVAFQLDSDVVSQACHLLSLSGGATYNIAFSLHPSGRIQMSPVADSNANFDFENGKIDGDSAGNFFFKGTHEIAPGVAEPFLSLGRLVIAVMNAELLSQVDHYSTEEGYIEFRWRTKPRLYLQIWHNSEDSSFMEPTIDASYFDDLSLMFTYINLGSRTLMREVRFSHHDEIEEMLVLLHNSKTTQDLIDSLFPPT